MSRLRLLLLVLITSAALWLLWPARARVPAPFVPLHEQLAGFETLEVSLGWPDGPLPPDEAVTVRVGPGRQARVEAGGSALVWNDGAVKLAAEGLSIPLLDATQQADDLYDALQDGFAEATWSLIPPPRLGVLPIAPEATWVAVQLPFDWAERTELLLAVSDDGALRYAALSGVRAPFTVSATPMRGGAQTVTLSSGALVRLPIRDFRVQ